MSSFFIILVLKLNFLYCFQSLGMFSLQIWVKTAEVLARDRLLGSFSVSPFILYRSISFSLFTEVVDHKIVPSLK